MEGGPGGPRGGGRGGGGRGGRVCSPLVPYIVKTRIFNCKMSYVRITVSDSDPDWIRIQSGQLIRRSGYGFRIRIQEGKNGPQK